MGLQGKHIVLDPAICTGCSICELACSFAKFRVFNPRRSMIRVSYDYEVGRVEAVTVCSQCGVCVDHCPTGALRVDGGIVVLDYGVCTGCLACAKACPSGSYVVIDGRPYKCDLCGGGDPWCVRFCARGALRVA